MCGGSSYPVDHQLQRALRRADQPHAVVDTARAQATLSDLEAATFTQQDAVGRHADVVELHLGVAVCKHKRRDVGAQST